MQIGENDILIIEGIHALDDKLTSNISTTTKEKD